MFRSHLLYSVFERQRPVSQYGQGNGAWNVIKGSLNNESVVVSVGVGHDISFDLAVSAQHGCKILLLDPSPTGKATIEKHTPLPAGMRFFPVGLAATDGEIHFAKPMHPDEGSYRLSGDQTSPPEFSFPCTRLSSFMNAEKITDVDLLKIDIEGFEYAVIKDMVRSRCRVKQLCVEFHHGLVPGITRMHTILAMVRLAAAGYRLCNHEGLNHTFQWRMQGLK